MTFSSPTPILIALLPLTLLAASFGCEFDKQLGDDATDTDLGETGGNDPATGGGASESDGGGPGASPIAVEDAAATMAATRCAAYFACACEATFQGVWATPAECEADVEEAFANAILVGQSAGLTYDPGCVAEFVEFYATPDCSEPTSPATEAAWWDVMHCPLFHGELEAGAPCDEVNVFLPGASECGVGLVCTGDSCQAPKLDGEPCEGAGQGVQDCQNGSFCDPSTVPPRCAPRRAIGQPCDDDEPCASATSCTDGICTANPGPGESCLANADCGYGLCDPDGFVCEEVPAACSPWAIEIQDACDAARTQASLFVELNSDCEADEDCVVADASCWSEAQCGSAALAEGYDADTWAALVAGMEAQCTECPTSMCEPSASCNAGKCTL